MANKTATQIIEECGNLVQLLREISPNLRVGSVNVDTLANTSTDLHESNQTIAEAKSKMVGHRAQQAKRMRAAKGALTALRDAVRTDFGADSPEYERAGRTPLSKRGRGASKKKATEAVTPVAITTN